MRLSTKGRYAVAAMMELAVHNKSGPMRLADISVHQGISVSYLEQLFARLRRNNLVSGARGPGGGYCLTRPAERITVAEILAAVDDGALVRRDSNRYWHSGEQHLPNALWRDLSSQLYDFLDGITLGEAVETGTVQMAMSKCGAANGQRGVQNQQAA